MEQPAQPAYHHAIFALRKQPAYHVVTAIMEIHVQLAYLHVKIVVLHQSAKHVYMDTI